MSNPMATRFEVRSPNPNTNTFLALAAYYQAMQDGIKVAVNSGKTTDELEKELSKSPEEKGIYLEEGRAYRSEDDVFDHFTPEERNRMFGSHPATVYENIIALDNYKDKLAVLMADNVISDKIIKSYATAVTNRWVTEIINRLVPEYMDLVRGCKMLHEDSYDSKEDVDIDSENWSKVNIIRHYLMKDNKTQASLFNRVREAAAKKDYDTLSELQIEMSKIIGDLRDAYSVYKRNILDEI
jgi:glutamine synthetase